MLTSSDVTYFSIDTVCRHLNTSQFESIYLCFENNSKLEPRDIVTLLGALAKQTGLAELHLLLTS